MLYLSVEANEALAALRSSPSMAQLVERLDAALDRLEGDPGRIDNRHHAFRGGLWCIVVSGSGLTYVLLWEEYDPTEADPEAEHHPDDVLVSYVGPDFR